MMIYEGYYIFCSFLLYHRLWIIFAIIVKYYLLSLQYVVVVQL